ncbi:TetR/AcrR family transcriptional regulator [Micromonospora sp. NPDC049559]|uniref:TetR/AcrR family transcriptional regulator n=1 Tax=Micromonospora sp. NPDC049559 TaxID=3155923 RepID=UPI00344260F1
MTTEDRDSPGPPGGRLLWESRQRPGRGPRPALSLERIVREGIEVADTEGLATLSMQRLAARLGAGTMSLYRYVPSKDELVVLMFDAIIGDPPATDPADWRGSLRGWALGVREAFHRHPWALAVAGSSRVMGPNETAWTEAALYALSGTGLPPDAMMDMLFLVNGYVRGAAQLSVDPAHGPVFDLTAVLESERRDRYPTLLAVVTSDEVTEAYDHRTDRGFEWGLRRVLDGIDLFLTARREPQE